MIVELCGTDLLELVNGNQISVGNLIVRPTDANASRVEGDFGTPHGGSNNRSAGQISARRRSARAGATRTGQRWMLAHYPNGRCAAACTNTWDKGDLMLYDYDTKRALCPAHGKLEFPNLPIPEGL